MEFFEAMFYLVAKEHTQCVVRPESVTRARMDDSPQTATRCLCDRGERPRAKCCELKRSKTCEVWITIREDETRSRRR